MFETPRQGLNQRQAETVDKLLAAGLEELRSVGHDGLTIRTVAQRAGVSPATAYTYLASKNHLFAELFWRHVSAEGAEPASGVNPTERLRAEMRALARQVEQEPELAAAVTPALLGSDPDVARLRLRIGSEFVRRFERALGEGADGAVIRTVTLAFSGALLQVGMGLMTYDDLAASLDEVVDVVMKGKR